MKKIYINENTRFFYMRKIPIVANVENGSIVGLTKEGVDFWKKIQKNQAIEIDQISKNQELYKHLTDNDIISVNKYQKTKNKKLSLTSAYLHVTNKCNLRCLGCYSMDDRNINKQFEPSIEELKLAMKRLRNADVKILIISGGEPFLRRDLKDLLFYGKKILKFEHIQVITNGTLSIDYSKFLGLIDLINVSVDGFSLQRPTFIRDKGIFLKIMKTISKLKELDFVVDILPTLHRENIQFMKDYKKLANDFGVGLSYSLLSVCETSELDSFIPKNDELRSLADNILETGDQIEDMNLYADLQASLNCGAAMNLVSISSDGTIYPCHMLHMPELGLGNIYQHSLEIENLNPKILQTFHTTNVETIPGCKQCEFKYFCAGGCRARSYYEYQTINEKDRYCEHMNYFYQQVTDELLHELGITSH